MIKTYQAKESGLAQLFEQYKEQVQHLQNWQEQIIEKERKLEAVS